LHGRNTRQVPSTPRKPVPARRTTAAVVTALLGVVTAVVLFGFVANLFTKPGTEGRLGRNVYDVGGARVLSRRISEGGPILLQALVGNRNIYVKHLGVETTKGWDSYDDQTETAA